MVGWGGGGGGGRGRGEGGGGWGRVEAGRCTTMRPIPSAITYQRCHSSRRATLRRCTFGRQAHHVTEVHLWPSQGQRPRPPWEEGAGGGRSGGTRLCGRGAPFLPPPPHSSSPLLFHIPSTTLEGVRVREVSKLSARHSFPVWSEATRGGGGGEEGERGGRGAGRWGESGVREGRNEDECGEERKVGREKRKIRGETRALRAHMLL